MDSRPLSGRSQSPAGNVLRQCSAGFLETSRPGDPCPRP